MVIIIKISIIKIILIKKIITIILIPGIIKNKKVDYNSNDVDNNKNNNITINTENINFKKYINVDLYPLIRNRLNINPNNIINVNVNVLGDGNCLFRFISRFVFGIEELHGRIRNEIYEEA